MNKIVNKYLLAGDNFMLELYSRQTRFTDNACRLFTKHYERLNKFKETGDLKHIHKNELDEGYFAHDAAYSVSKDLVKRTI